MTTLQGHGYFGGVLLACSGAAGPNQPPRGARQSAKDAHLKKLNPTPDRSLEEDMVSKITPLYSDSIAVSTFKPVLDDVHNALKF